MMTIRIILIVLLLFCLPTNAAEKNSQPIISNDEFNEIYRAKDIEKMKELADTGDAQAQTWYGLMLQNKSEYAEALKWYTRAAEQGNVSAMSKAAFMHELGLGTAKSSEAAAVWYKKGAELGHAYFQVDYAQALLKATKTADNEGAALKWFLKAAGQRDSEAYLELAQLYAKGTSTYDPMKAYVYARMFEEHPYDSAPRDMLKEVAALRKAMKKEMSDEQRSAAEDMIEELEARYDTRQ